MLCIIYTLERVWNVYTHIRLRRCRSVFKMRTFFKKKRRNAIHSLLHKFYIIPLGSAPTKCGSLQENNLPIPRINCFNSFIWSHMANYEKLCRVWKLFHLDSLLNGKRIKWREKNKNTESNNRNKVRFMSEEKAKFINMDAKMCSEKNFDCKW